MGMDCSRYVPTECAAPGHRSHIYLAPALEGGRRDENIQPAHGERRGGRDTDEEDATRTNVPEHPVPVGAVPDSVGEVSVSHGPESPESGLSVPVGAVPASVGEVSVSYVPESPASEPPVPVVAVSTSVGAAPEFHGPESPSTELPFPEGPVAVNTHRSLYVEEQTQRNEAWKDARKDVASFGSRGSESPASETPVPVDAVPASFGEVSVLHVPESPESGLSIPVGAVPAPVGEVSVSYVPESPAPEPPVPVVAVSASVGAAPELHGPESPATEFSVPEGPVVVNMHRSVHVEEQKLRKEVGKDWRKDVASFGSRGSDFPTSVPPVPEESEVAKVAANPDCAEFQTAASGSQDVGSNLAAEEALESNWESFVDPGTVMLLRKWRDKVTDKDDRDSFVHMLIHELQPGMGDFLRSMLGELETFLVDVAEERLDQEISFSDKDQQCLGAVRYLFHLLRNPADADGKLELAFSLGTFDNPWLDTDGDDEEMSLFFVLHRDGWATPRLQHIAARCKRWCGINGMAWHGPEGRNNRLQVWELFQRAYTDHPTPETSQFDFIEKFAASIDNTSEGIICEMCTST